MTLPEINTALNIDSSATLAPNHEITQFAYIGISRCGCVRAITMDRGGHDKETRRNVREFMKMGHVERVTLETARARLCITYHPKQTCPHPQECPHGAIA